MATQGVTTTQALENSIPAMIAGARLVREFEGQVPKTVDRQRLEDNTGTNWSEVALAHLSAQYIPESIYPMNSPQQMSDALFSITPLVVGVQTIVTDRTLARITKQAVAKLGPLAQNAIQRKKDIDGTLLFAGASNTIGTTTTTLYHGLLAAAVAQIYGNTTETGIGTGELYFTCHPYQVKQLRDEIVAGIGTYTVPTGITEDIYRRGFEGTCAQTNVMSDGNLAITSNSAKAGCYSRMAIVLVEGRSPRAETRRRPDIGGGANEMFQFDEYAYGERSAGNWLVQILTDATAPTS